MSLVPAWYCEDLLIFVFCDGKLNILGFWINCQTKQAIKYIKLWENVMAMFHYSLKCCRPNGQLIKWESNWQLDGCSQHNISPTWQTWGIGNWNECWPSQLLLFHFIVELTSGTASGMPHDVLTKGSWHVSPTFKSSMTPGVTLGHWKVFLWALLLKWQRRSWTMLVLSGGTVKLYFMEADRSENQIKLELSAWLDTTRANWGKNK